MDGRTVFALAKWAAACLQVFVAVVLRQWRLLMVAAVGTLPTLAHAWCYYDAELKRTVCEPPGIVITSPTNGAVLGPSPANVTIATAPQSSGSITKVEFYAGATLLQTVTTAPYSYVWTGRTSGSYTVTAKVYDLSPGHAGTPQSTVSAPVTFTVNTAPTATLTAPSNGAVYTSAPANVTLTANASDSDGSITKVEFYNGGSLLGTSTTQPYSLAWNGVSAGTFSVKARAYDNSGSWTDSATASIRVNAAPSASVTSPAGGSVVNAPGAFSLSASASDSDGTVSQVRFFANGSLIGTGALSGQSYVLSWSSVAAGTYAITAEVTDNNGSVTLSSPVSVTVNALPTVSLTAPANGTVFANAPASISLSANAADSDGSISKVEIYNGGSLLATLTSAPYTYTWSSVPAGTYVLKARAYDNRGVTTDSATATVRVNAAPTVSLTGPANGTTASYPGAFTLSATAADGDGGVSQVRFYANGSLVGNGTASGSTYSFSWSNVAAGSYSITAQVTDSDGVVVTSAPVSISVTTLPAVNITAPLNGAVYAMSPASVSLNANASDSGGTITKVDYYNGASLIGTATAAPYAFAWNSVAPGTYTLTARATDDHGVSASSSAITVIVNALPSASLAASPTAAVAPATFQLSATASDTDGSIAKVEFYNGSTLIGTVNAAPFNFNWSNVAAGRYSVVARAYDNRGGFTNSSPVTLVAGSAPSITLSSPTNGGQYAPGSNITITAQASDADGSVASVQFYDGSTWLGNGTQSGSTYSWNWVAPPVGTHVVTAKATDNNGYTSTAVATIQVVAGSQISPPNLAGSVGGSLAGSAGVSSGAAGYAVPIALPPGTAGFAPSVSLQYSSQGGMGYLGHGWTVAGLSSITRCGKTIAQDGVRTAVALTAADQFCLDGQRLLLVPGTTNEYRTQIDSFSKILSNGTDTAKGPDSWTVYTKGGEILTFGGTTDSTIEAQGKTTVLTWALSRATDRRGNYYSVSYCKSYASDASSFCSAIGSADPKTPQEFFPTRIAYTGNSTSGLQPYNAVNFIYESRIDTWQGFVAGTDLQRTQRLKAVQTRVNTDGAGNGGTLVRDYRVAYVTNSLNGRSLVDTISDCDGAGNCLTPTKFTWTQRDNSANNVHAAGSGDWGGPTPAIQGMNQTTLSPEQQVQTSVLMGDFDGDGATDMVYSDGSGTWRVCLGRSTAFSCQNWTGPALASRYVLTGDFNGDGRTDLAIPPAAGATNWNVCLSTGSGFNCSTWNGLSASGGVNNYLIGDFNGDGRDDIIGVDRYSHYGGSFLCKSVGNGFEGGGCVPYNTADFVDATFADAETGARFFRSAGDFNGDGRLDFVVSRKNNTAPIFTTSVLTTTDTGLFYAMAAQDVTMPVMPPPGSTVIAEINGDPYDSYSDFFSIYSTNQVAYDHVCRSSGTGLRCTRVSGAPYGLGGASMPTVADLDGDGRPEVSSWGVCQVGESAPYQYGTSYGSTTNFACNTTWPAWNPSSYLTYFVGDFNGDGIPDRAFYVQSTGTWQVALTGNGGPQDLLSTVTDGNGQQTQFSYKGLNDATVHTRGADVSYPKRNVASTNPVVSELRVSNAQGGWLKTDYAYKGLRADSQGRGLLGFEQITSVDLVNGITTVATQSQDYPYIGLPLTSTSTQTNNTVLSQSTTTWSSLSTVGGAVSPYVSASSVVKKDLNGAVLPRVDFAVNAGGIDAYGNLLNTTETITDGTDVYTTTTVNAYDNLTSNWLLGLLRTSAVTKGAPGVPNVTRTIGIDYNTPNYPDVLRETVEPNDATLAYKLVTEYGRDASYGVVTTKTLKWRDPVSSTDKTRVVETTTYDSRARFATTVKNAKNQQESRVRDDAYGNLTGLTGPNLLTTTWQYDGWGRKTREDRADSTSTTSAYRKCVDTCLNGAVSVAISQSWAGAYQTSAPAETFSDTLGRTVLNRGWGFDGRAVLTEQVYDTNGRLAQVSRPHFSADTAVWTYYDSDAIGRVWQMRAPNSAGTGTDTTTTTFNGQSVTTTNAKLQNRTELRNGVGKLKSVTDHYGWTTSYLYDAFGNLLRTTDPKGNQINVQYDQLGRKTKLTDPDLGVINYWVDPLGQTWKQVDAKSQTTTFDFDELGRMVHRLEADLESYWVYDTATTGVGKLGEAYTWAAGAKDYRRIYSYDSLSRPAATTVSLDWDYTSEYGYDSFGHQSSTTYRRAPRGGGASAAVTIYNSYNAQGYLANISRDSDGASSSVWQALAADAEGHTTKEQLANGLKTDRSYNPYTGRAESVTTGPDNGSGAAQNTHQNDLYQYDSLGNLSDRWQLMATGGTWMHEHFTYDSLNRLLTSAVDGQASKGYAYDELGNLSTKANVGTLAYPASGASSMRPHAVSGITGTVAGITNPSFSYDNNGNLTNGLGRAYGWTSFNQARDIDKLSGGTAVQRTSFVFGTEHQRTRQTVSPMSGGVPGAATSVIYYGAGIEKEIDQVGGTTTIRTYLPSGLGYLEEKLSGTAIAANASATRNTRYFLGDHLGSPIAVVDDAQTVLQRMSYDAWGRRRNADGSDDAWTSLGSLKNGQDHTGYTGHENLDQLGLVHMNGRVYDPIVGRFVSADPHVTDARDSQGLNRYSYVLNNPFRYTDPSGYDPQRLETVEMDAVHAGGGLAALTYTLGSQRFRPVYVPLIRLGNAVLRSGVILRPIAVRSLARGGLTILVGGGPADIPVDALAGLVVIGSMIYECTQHCGELASALSQSASSDPTSQAAPGVNSASTPPGGPEGDDGDNSKPKRITNEKHHPNSKSPEPKNVDQLYENSVIDKNGVRWAKDADGTVHRFSKPSNGETHWNGSTGGVDPIQPQNIPVEIRRLFGFKG